MIEENKGYTTVTYCFRFYDKHLDWLFNTRILYNKVVKHYYNLLANNLEWLFMSNFNLMRELEILTVGSREMKKAGMEAKYPLTDLPVIPLYFRRAAINCAISMIRSFQTRKNQAESRQQEKGSDFGSYSSIAGTFSAAPVYYKGMYKEWKEDSILLKVYTGERWKWSRYRFTGRKLPDGAEVLSPTIDAEIKQAYLHVPIKKQVEDIRPVKERMQEEEKILAISFPGNDSLAVGAILRRDGSFEKSVFLQGGLELKARKNTLKRKWKKQQERGNAGKKYLRKIEHLNTYYAHLTSRRIVEFCKEQEIKIIAVPNYRQAINFSKTGYQKIDHFEWIGRRIIRYLKYKAFSEGIIVSAVPICHISNCCSECGMEIRRYNTGHIPSKNYYGGQLFLCPNGHQGSSGLNTAQNVGKRFLSYYKEEQES